MIDDGFADDTSPDLANGGGELIPFPNLRANRAVGEAWLAEIKACNARLETKHLFISPLGALDDLIRRRAMPALPWPSEWPDLARRAHCHPGDSIAIVGPPGGGKTSHAIQICRSAMGSGIPVLWAPLDLDAAQIAVRTVANMHGKHVIEIREQWTRERIAHSLAAVDDLWRFVDRYTDPDVQIGAIRDAVNLAKRIYRVPPLVVVDYLGKLASLSRDIRLGTIHAAEQLRQLAVSEECYLIMLAQPSRSSSAILTGRTPIDAATDAIGVAGDSSEVENSCRVVIALNMFKTDDAPILDAHVLVSKSNTGLEGRVGFKFTKSGGVWSELNYLPATPGEVKADGEKEKADKRRVQPPRSPVEIRVDLNRHKSADAETQVQRELYAAIVKAGTEGIAIDARLIFGGRLRAGAIRQALAELAAKKLIERIDRLRWRARHNQ